MANAKRLPSGMWRVRAYIGKDEKGVKHYKSFTDSDRLRCERIAAEYADEHRGFNSSESFAHYMEAYITSRKAVLSPSTIRGYKNIQTQLKTHYKAFCASQVVDIDKDMLQTMINDMTLFVKPKTIRNRHGLISAVMKYAEVNPPYVKLPERTKPDLKIPDVADVKKLLKEAEGTELEIPIMLAAFAPMRRGEIVALKMEDIIGNTIHVKRAIVEDGDGNLIEKSPKTYDSAREIPMPKEIIDKIRKKGYVVDIDRPRILTMRFERLAKKCGLEGTRFHDLRHFCCSWLHSQGVPEETILQRGGWTTSGVMKQVYRHALASETAKVNKEITKKISKILA